MVLHRPVELAAFLGLARPKTPYGSSRCRIRPMYGWPRVLVRDGIVLFFVGVLTMTVTDTPDDGLAPPPCGNSDWQQILSFFLALSVAIVIAEGLNWLAWSVSRYMRRKSDSSFPQTDRDMVAGVDLLFPLGWGGAVLGAGLLFLSHMLYGPSPCKPAKLDIRYLAAAFTLGYGLLVVTAVGLDIALKYTNRSKSCV